MCLRGVIFKKVRLLALFGRIPHNYNVPIFRAGQMSALLRGHFLLGREMHMDQATYSPLIATKLHIPTYGSDLLHRHQLVEEIDEVGMARVILICAPAGFGKTTAVSQWISSAGKPAGWLSLDESDSDPARFWRYLAKAISAGQKEAGREPSASLDLSYTASADHLLSVLLEEIAAIHTDYYLVLDDYHLIKEPSIHEGMQTLLQHASPFCTSSSSRVKSRRCPCIVCVSASSLGNWGLSSFASMKRNATACLMS